MNYRRRKKLTGESNYKCALKMHEIETSGKYDTKEIAIARMWFVDEMSPNAISDSGRVQSKRKQNMSSDMILVYLRNMFPDIVYDETPTRSMRAHDKVHMRNTYFYRKFVKQMNCQKCGDPAQVVDHIVPVSCGGSDAPDNIQYLCKRCHTQKTKEERESGMWYRRENKI